MSSSTTTNTVSVPIYQSFKTSLHLPPTPASSSLEKTQVRELSSQKYGSLNTTSPYFETLSDSRPVTPSQTTISSNNNDESLYLLWTQELLRERGFTSTDDYIKKDEEDDSSVSDMSSISSEEEEEEEEEDKINIDHYIAEQRKLFSPAPSSLHAYSHRASMVSHYSSIASNNNAMDETAVEENATNLNPISIFFHNCFSSCL